MFKIRLKLAPFHMTGLVALDERRRLKLPDVAELVSDDAHQVETPVDEGFARLYFPRDRVLSTKAIPLAWLSPGDIVDEADVAGGPVRLNKLMKPERARELYVRAWHDEEVDLPHDDFGGPPPEADPNFSE